MKKILLSIFSLGFVASVTAQCNEIFISEYVEGSINNKAIELYNPTSADIDLSSYELWRYSNGGTTIDAKKKLKLSGTIAAKSTYVIVIDKRDPNGTGQEYPVWSCLQDKADAFMCPDYNVNNVMYFNGNDVLALLKGGTTVVDFFGVLGQDPAPGDGNGAAWPDSNANGGLTIDNTLIRKESVQGGVTSPVAVATNPNADFDPRLEWYSAGRNRFMNLGSHDCSCNTTNVTKIDTNYGCPPLSISEIEGAQFSVYPNPSTAGFVKIQSSIKPSTITVYNLTGKIVLNQARVNTASEINTAGLNKGLYFVKVRFENGLVGTRKIVIE